MGWCCVCSNDDPSPRLQVWFRELHVGSLSLLFLALIGIIHAQYSHHCLQFIHLIFLSTTLLMEVAFSDWQLFWPPHYRYNLFSIQNRFWLPNCDGHICPWVLSVYQFKYVGLILPYFCKCLCLGSKGPLEFKRYPGSILSVKALSTPPSPPAFQISYVFIQKGYAFSTLLEIPAKDNV